MKMTELHYTAIKMGLKPENFLLEILILGFAFPGLNLSSIVSYTELGCTTGNFHEH